MQGKKHQTLHYIQIHVSTKVWVKKKINTAQTMHLSEGNTILCTLMSIRFLALSLNDIYINHIQAK